MKSKILTFIFVLFSTLSFAQSQTNLSSIVKQKYVSENSNYQLFRTQNYWTFIKLDTRNGKMWQVHFSVSKDDARGVLVLNSIPLVSKEKEKKGRFTLYPTENIYNFLLLDRINGNVWQVQWSFDPEKRLVVPITSLKTQLLELLMDSSENKNNQ